MARLSIRLRSAVWRHSNSLNFLCRDRISCDCVALANNVSDVPRYYFHSPCAVSRPRSILDLVDLEQAMSEAERRDRAIASADALNGHPHPRVWLSSSPMSNGHQSSSVGGVMSSRADIDIDCTSPSVPPIIGWNSRARPAHRKTEHWTRPTHAANRAAATAKVGEVNSSRSATA